MTYLLDPSVLIPLLLSGHTHHGLAARWVAGKKTAVCPISELAFLRTATANYNSDQQDARTVLENFRKTDAPQFLADDLSPLEAAPFPSSKKSTDWYLSELAQKHGMKLATLDGGIKHPAAQLIPSENPSRETPSS